MSLIEREGRIVAVSFGHPDPEDESKWVDDGKTYLTIAVEGDEPCWLGSATITYEDRSEGNKS